MTRYIANEENLKMMMNLLRDKSKNIQFEAFHVFKVSRFVEWNKVVEELIDTFLIATGLCGESE